MVCDLDSVDWVLAWLKVNDRKGWDKIDDWEGTLKRYVEKCRINSHWQAPPHHPGYRDRFSIATRERIYDQV